jgi:hypothetical protein
MKQRTWKNMTYKDTGERVTDGQDANQEASRLPFSLPPSLDEVPLDPAVYGHDYCVWTWMMVIGP